MKKSALHVMIMLAVVLFLVLGCAGLQAPVTAADSHGTKTIDMKADSYKFEPNNIRAEQGDTIILNITNVSSKQHNFTIKDPGGRVMQSVELLPGKTEQVKITLTERGTYGFYCNKPFHPTLGMKGRIEAGSGSQP